MDRVCSYSKGLDKLCLYLYDDALLCSIAIVNIFELPFNNFRLKTTPRSCLYIPLRCSITIHTHESNSKCRNVCCLRYVETNHKINEYICPEF